MRGPNHLPVFFKLDGNPCLLVGGGNVAAHKAEILAETGARLTVVAPDICGSIRQAAQEGKLQWLARPFHDGDCAGFHLIIAATPDEEVNRAVFREAHALGIPVNVVDRPELCTVIFGASWRAGRLAISISTGGCAPFMAAAVRDRIGTIASGMVPWVETAARFRAAVRKAVTSAVERDRLYRQFIERSTADTVGNAPDSDQLSEWIDWLESGVKGQRGKGAEG